MNGLTDELNSALFWCVRVGQHTMRSHPNLRVPRGLTLALLLVLEDQLENILGSASGTARPSGAGQLVPDGWITTAQAAMILGCSPRWAREIAESLGGRKHGGRWLIPRHAVENYARNRKEQQRK